MLIINNILVSQPVSYCHPNKGANSSGSTFVSKLHWVICMI